MPVCVVDHYTRSMLQDQRDVLFVFGDNMVRTGYGGQAKECRGEPNAVGIPTKWYPGNQFTAFFTDGDFFKVRPEIDKAFDKLEDHLLRGGTIVLPSAGVGTGLAALERNAPMINTYIRNRIQNLYQIAFSG